MINHSNQSTQNWQQIILASFPNFGEKGSSFKLWRRELQFELELSSLIITARVSQSFWHFGCITVCWWIYEVILPWIQSTGLSWGAYRNSWALWKIVTAEPESGFLLAYRGFVGFSFGREEVVSFGGNNGHISMLRGECDGSDTFKECSIFPFDDALAY